MQKFMCLIWFDDTSFAGMTEEEGKALTDATIEEARCALMGVFAPLVGIIGTMQAAEALKLLVGTGTSLAGRLQMLDARTMEWHEIRMARQAQCAVCALRPASDPSASA